MLLVMDVCINLITKCQHIRQHNYCFFYNFVVIESSVMKMIKLLTDGVSVS
jgi:hypothetical protein